MPTILTLGLGYDAPSIIYRDIATSLIGDLVIESPLYGIVELEEAPIAEVVPETTYVYGHIELSTLIFGTVVSGQPIYAVVSEKGPPMPNEANKVIMFVQEDRTLTLTVHQDNGTPTNLTGAKIWFTVKERTSDPDSEAIIQKKNAAAGGNDSQITITNALNGSAEIYLVPTDSEQVNPGIYVFDIRVTLASGKTYTVTRDKITFKEDVTKTRT